MTAMVRDPVPGGLLAVRDLVKRFGAITALGGVDLDLREREIHAVVGPTGAGKSTLVDVLSGLDTYDTGEVVYRGHPIRLRSRRDAYRIGMTVVAQEPAVVPDLSVYENIVLPHWGRAEPADLRKRVASILTSFGWADALALDGPAGRLGLAQMRLVELARAFSARAKVFLLDEPFAALSRRDIESVIGVMMRLRVAGCGLLVTGVRLDDVASFADRVTGLSAGRTTAATRPPAGTSTASPPRAAGLEARSAVPRPGERRSAVALAVRRLGAPPDVQDLSVTVEAGEIVGLFGLRDAGQSAAIEALAGLRPWAAGRVDVGGLPLVSNGPMLARAAGLRVVTAAQPLPLPLGTARANLQLLAPGPRPLEDVWQQLDLPPGELDASVAGMPPGIARRILLAGALVGRPPMLLLDEPLRGLAPDTRSAAIAALLAAARDGSGALIATAEPEALLGLAHRIVVLREGHCIADLPAALADAEALTMLSTTGTAMARNTSVLTDLTRENGGAAFWVLRRAAHVVCLNAIVADARSDPGLRAARAVPFAATRIEAALRHEGLDFVREPDGTRATVLVPIRTRRGRDFGWIGLTLPASAALPHASAVAFHIETLAARL